MIGLATFDAVEMPSAEPVGAVAGPRMVVVCAWCNTVQGHKGCAAADAGKTTHGICPTCKAVALNELGGACKEVGPS